MPTSTAVDMDALVDEAIDESFPCSDPPSFTPLHAGMPAPVRVPEAPLGPPPATERPRLSRGRARVRGLLFVLLGLGLAAACLGALARRRSSESR